jgi:integrase-like protein
LLFSKLSIRLSFVNRAAFVRMFVRFCGLRHPSELGLEDVQRFLTDLVVERNLSASTQQQALGALLFLYPHVVGPASRGLGTAAEGAGAHDLAGGADA